MLKLTFLNYLQTENKTLGVLLNKLNQLQQWNQYFSKCTEEKNLTQHCQIVNLAGTSLIMIADSPQWVMRLRFYIPELLPKLRAYAGLETIQSICCKARPSHFAATKQKNRPKQVISSENAAILREAAHKLRDDKLRAILEKIALRVNSA